MSAPEKDLIAAEIERCEEEKARLYSEYVSYVYRIKGLILLLEKETNEQKPDLFREEF